MEYEPHPFFDLSLAQRDVDATVAIQTPEIIMLNILVLALPFYSPDGRLSGIRIGALSCNIRKLPFYCVKFSLNIRFSRF